MIDKILKKLEEDINDYLNAYTEFNLEIEDIGKKNINSGDALAANKIIMSLVSIEEEATLKNNYPIKRIDSGFTSQKSALYLNLVLLFSANCEQYLESIKHIGFILQYFQVNTKIKLVTEDPVIEYDMLCNLHNVSFENLYNLWSIFGGHYHPSILYKLKIVMIQEAKIDSSPAILNVEQNQKFK